MPRKEEPLAAPTDASGRLSAQLRQSRKAAGLGLRAAAQAAGCDHTHLSHVEHGDSLPSEPLVLQLDVTYGANGLLLSLYEEVLGERRRRAYAEALSRRRQPRAQLAEATGRDYWVPPEDAALPIPGDHSFFVGDVQSPIGILLKHGTWFTKSWRLRNTGSVRWRDRFLQRVGPNAAATLVASDRAVRIADTDPGQEVTIEVSCRAQWIESTSVAHFKMVFADGRLCWPDQYSHGVDLLVTATTGESCGCGSCQSIGPLEPKHRLSGR